MTTTRAMKKRSALKMRGVIIIIECPLSKKMTPLKGHVQKKDAIEMSAGIDLINRFIYQIVFDNVNLARAVRSYGQES